MERSCGWKRWMGAVTDRLTIGAAGQHVVEDRGFGSP